MSGSILLIITYFVIAVVLLTIVLFVIQKSKINNIKIELDELERTKNIISSTPVIVELSKIEAIIKTEKLEEKYKGWQQKFEYIKTKRINKINDMLIDLDLSFNNKDYATSKIKLAKTQIEIYKVKTSIDNLMSEIKEITISEEKYRNIVTKLKTKYRELTKIFNDNKSDYKEVESAIDLQLETIEKKFLDFEQVMEKNEYTEVVHVVKAIDTMIEHMTIVINEIPNLVLLGIDLIPKRLEEIERISSEMLNEGYNLDYFNLNYNMEETKKNVTFIIDKVKVLNLDECMFELKTILDYIDSLFGDFEKETSMKKTYDSNIDYFDKKLKKNNKIVKDIYNQIDDIKNMYDLKDDDIKFLYEINERLIAINVNYKSFKSKIENRELPYSKMVKELEVFSNLLNELEEDLDVSLKSLGSMYDDEVRAREQLDEIQTIITQCRIRIRSYKLPVISNDYFIQLTEANEAIFEVLKELSKKPIEIKVLNTRVDTARDLVLKLFNTTNEMIRNAQMTELAIVYGNRYRSEYVEIDTGLNEAERLFYKGSYKYSLDRCLSALEIIETDIRVKIKEGAIY